MSRVVTAVGILLLVAGTGIDSYSLWVDWQEEQAIRNAKGIGRR